MAVVGIVGGGPAGISAAVQLKRYGLEPVVFEKDEIGGLVRNAYSIRNSMYFPEGISGKRVASILKRYVEIYGIKVIYDEVIDIRYKEPEMVIYTKRGDYAFKYTVIASGTQPKRVNFKFERLYYHIVDLPKGYLGRVMILGGGDTSYDYALSVAGRSDEVIIMVRSTPKAIDSLIKEVDRCKNVKVMIGRILEFSDGTAITTVGKFNIDILLVAIGRIPNDNFAKNVKGNPRVFWAGDVKNGWYRQSSIAIADGIKAAMQIWRMEKYGNI